MITTKNITFFLLVGLVTTLSAPGCNSTSQGAAQTNRLQKAAEPNPNVGRDRADHDCTVVLRQVSRGRLPDGRLETSCSEGDGQCWYVWRGTMDVSSSALAQGSIPVLLYKSAWDNHWWEVEATAEEEDNGTSGSFRRFSFRIAAHTAAEGASMSTLMRTRIELVPALVAPNGDRLFDHNRNPGDFDNYVLDSNNNWVLSDAPAVCPASPPRSVIAFRGDWSIHRYGALVSGGQVTIHYDPARLPQCISSRTDGSPSWNILGHALFSPSGQTISGPLTTYSVNPDQVTIVVPKTWTLDIPSGTNQVAFWFEVGGAQCETHWDSNFGANFVFPVLAASPDSEIRWAGDGGSVISRGACDSAETAGIPDRITLDDWAITRGDCKWVDIDVYAPGVTDAAENHPEWIMAQVVVSRDGQEPTAVFLDFVQPVGNNFRYRWYLSDGTDFLYEPWDRFDYRFRFSLDGNSWFEEGRTRSLVRDASWCPASSWGTDRCP